ncbi:unnamed protein product [Pieris macdunnoughi]|uniref:Uncharacterized protein n=1 Tax=Pieris macdunnoughi TaxID=345717 RepID=A0A821UG49_9NEOP|nr:unnamed protein product [Pieris macdunnoughi]
MSTEADENIKIPRRRKNCVNKEDYKSEIIKKARLKGNPYKNWKGNLIPGKIPDSDCSCKKLCLQRVNDDERLQLFCNFSSSNTKNEQDIYLQSLISIQ